MKSYTTSRNPAGINRNTAVSENGNPSKLNIRRTAVVRSSTRPVFHYDDGADTLFGQTGLPRKRGSGLRLPRGESEDVSAIELQ